MTDSNEPDETPADPAAPADEAADAATLDAESGEPAQDASQAEALTGAAAANAVDTGPVDPGAAKSGGSAFMGVPIEVIISVGKARPLVSDLVKLRRDSVISLDTKIDDPVEIYVGEKLIARGELQEIEDSGGQLGVRLTEVADISAGA